jgi:hypothetical protein
MKAAVEELDLLEAVGLLRLVAGLATCEEALVSAALARFVDHTGLMPPSCVTRRSARPIAWRGPWASPMPTWTRRRPGRGGPGEPGGDEPGRCGGARRGHRAVPAAAAQVRARAAGRRGADLPRPALGSG